MPSAALFLLVEHCRFRQWGGISVLALASAGVMALLTADYSLGAVPRPAPSENLRPLAQKINRVTAASGESVRVFAPGFLPFLYYLHPDPVYVQTVAGLPPDAHFLLVRETDLPTVPTRSSPDGALRKPFERLDDKNRGRWYLLRVEAASESELVKFFTNSTPRAVDAPSHPLKSLAQLITCLPPPRSCLPLPPLPWGAHPVRWHPP